MYCDLVIEPDLVVCATGRGMKKRVDAVGKDVHFSPFFLFFFLFGRVLLLLPTMSYERSSAWGKDQKQEAPR